MVGFLASLAAVTMGWVPEGKFNIAHGLLLCASSLVTASLASFILGNCEFYTLSMLFIFIFLNYILF